MILAPAIPVLVIVAFFGALVFAVMGRQVSEGIVSWLKDAGRIAAFLAGPVGTISVKLTRWITHNVGAVFGDLERLTVTWFSALYQYFDLVITNALEWPLYLWRFQRWLIFVEIPKLVKAVPIPSVPTFPNIWKRLRAIEQALTRLGKLAGAGLAGLIAAAVWKHLRPYWHALQWLRSHFSALNHALPRVLPAPTFPSLKGIRARLRALEHKITPVAIAAAVAAALARMGLGWIRCNNVRRVGRSVCGLNPSLLESFLLDAATIFSIVSVVEFAKELRTVEDEAVAIMGRLVREWPA